MPDFLPDELILSVAPLLFYLLRQLELKYFFAPFFLIFILVFHVCIKFFHFPWCSFFCDLHYFFITTTTILVYFLFLFNVTCCFFLGL